MTRGSWLVVRVINAQREAPVSTRRMGWLASAIVRRLRLRAPGTLTIAFIDSRRMRSLNRRFLGHDRSTDVLSFRYNGEAVAGEILIAPREASRYASAHGIPYTQELSRYVVHGLLHWIGDEDRTARQQRRMREREDRLLAACVRR